MTTIFVSGAFNILHPGHIRLLKFAADCGDHLIVGVYSDCLAGENTYVSEDERWLTIQNLSIVNESFLIDQPPEQTIAQIKPDIVVKGKEYENQHNPELEVLQTYGGKLLFSSGDSVFSSFNLIREEIALSKLANFLQPHAFLNRRKIQKTTLLQQIESFNKINVCVFGDLIIDDYITCDALGMSQEDPTIVVSPTETKRFLGGAGILAAHVKSLGANQVHFFSISGMTDEPSKFAKQQLAEYQVLSNLLSDYSRPTTLKTRYRTNQKTLLRVNHLKQHAISEELQNQIFQKFTNLAKQIDLVIFSDFNYGALPQPLVNRITKYCLQHQIMMTADSQSSSQIGDVSRFSHTTLLTPTEREARLALHNQTDGLVVMAENLRQKTKTQHVLITMGNEGMLIQTEGQTDDVPALNPVAKDPAGAGDCLLALASLSLAAGGTIWEASYLGAIAAACQVSQLGNIPLKQSEVLQQLS